MGRSRPSPWSCFGRSRGAPQADRFKHAPTHMHVNPLGNPAAPPATDTDPEDDDLALGRAHEQARGQGTACRAMAECSLPPPPSSFTRKQRHQHKDQDSPRHLHTASAAEAKGKEQLAGQQAAHASGPAPKEQPSAVAHAQLLQQRCSALEQLLAQHKAQAEAHTSALMGSVLQLLESFRLQGFEVAADLDNLQDDLLDWSSSATCSPLPSLGPSTGVCSGTCSGGCSPSPPQRQAASPGAAGAPTSSGGSTQYATASSSSGSRFGGDQGCAGSPGAGQADPPGSPPVADASPGSRKRVVLRARRDHLESAFIQMVRTHVQGLQALSAQIAGGAAPPPEAAAAAGSGGAQ